jgi:hypothetical protein
MTIVSQYEQPAVAMAKPVGSHRICVSVGDVSIGLSGHSADDIALTPEMAPFQVAQDACDIEIAVDHVPHLESARTPPLFDSGALWTVHDGGAEYIFDFATPALGAHPYKRLHIDRQFRQAALLMNDQYSVGKKLIPLEYPVDELLVSHRLSCAGGVEFHGCGLVDSERGSFLFLGNSTAGKSTTARLWNSVREITVLSDDRIIVRRHQGQLWMYGSPWHGEAQYALPLQAPIQRIFVLEHGADNEIVPLSKSRAVAELFARSFLPFYAPEFLQSTLAFLSELAETIPSYRYRFRPELSAVEKVLNFHE